MVVAVTVEAMAAVMAEAMDSMVEVFAAAAGMAAEAGMAAALAAGTAVGAGTRPGWAEVASAAAMAAGAKESRHVYFIPCTRHRRGGLAGALDRARAISSSAPPDNDHCASGTCDARPRGVDHAKAEAIFSVRRFGAPRRHFHARHFDFPFFLPLRLKAPGTSSPCCSTDAVEHRDLREKI